jgi:hypothetical protein
MLNVRIWPVFGWPSVELVTFPVSVITNILPALASNAGVAENGTATSGALKPVVAEICLVVLSWLIAVLLCLCKSIRVCAAKWLSRSIRSTLVTPLPHKLELRIRLFLFFLPVLVLGNLRTS